MASAGTPDGETLNRFERRKLELRGRILDAAAELFGQQGIHASKVESICERADVARRTFFNHFPSKQHVVRELAGCSLDRLLVDIETARKAQRTTRDRLHHFFSSVADRTDEAGPMQREILTEFVHAVHESAEKSEHARKLHGAFEAIVRDGLAAGDVTRRYDVETLTEMILGAYYVLMFSFANLDDFPIRKQALAAARFLAGALAPGPEEE
ncbi:MAG: TetR/AcrR family transcriptional regulator [Myxococcota bacterium]